MNRLTAAGLTVVVPDPATVGLDGLSTTVTVWDPACRRVMVNDPVPLVMLAVPGSGEFWNVACGSVSVNVTVPLYPVATFPNASRAVTVYVAVPPAVTAPA